MARAIGRAKPFSGEVVRLYETGENEPGTDAVRALAKVFERSEPYIQFGVTAPPEAREQKAEYRTLSDTALEVAHAFDQLVPECKEHVRRQIELLKGVSTGNGGRIHAAQHDVEIKDGALQSRARSKTRKSVRKRTDSR